ALALENPLDIARTVNHANDFDALGNFSIKHKMVIESSNGPHPQAGQTLVPRLTFLSKARETDQVAERPPRSIAKPLCGGFAGLGEIGNVVYEVEARSRSSDGPAPHDFFRAAACARPSFRMASQSSGVISEGGPLSKPCTSRASIRSRVRRFFASRSS